MFSTLVLIILTWGFIGIILVGIGLSVQRLWGTVADSFDVILDSFWLGFAFLVFALQLWNFGFPINTASFYLLSAAGLLGLLFNVKSVIPSAAHVNLLLVFCMSIAVVYLAGLASFPFIRYDHGLYYSNMMQWAESFPIVKGLGNLYGRLAFNNSYYLFAAWIEVFPWIKKSHHLVTGALLMGLLIRILYSYFQILGSKSIEIRHIFYVFMFWPVIFLIQTSRIASPGADTAISILQIILFGKLLVFFEQSTFAYKRLVHTFFFLFILVVLGISIKVSMLVFGLSVLAIPLFFLPGPGPEAIKISQGRLLILIGVVVLLGLIPYIVRNIMVSGYIFYPMTWGGFPVGWRIPYAQCLDEMKWAMSYARAPGGGDYHQVLADMKWLGPWLSDNWKTPFSFKIPLCLALVGLTGILLRFLVIRKIQFISRRWVMFIPLVLAIIAWFFIAPDVRFAGALFWILSISLTILAMTWWVHSSNILKIICTLVFLSAVVYLFVESVKTVRVTFENARNLELHHVHVDGRIKLGPALNDIFSDLPIDGHYAQNKTDFGLVVFTPIKSESCWDKIPCTPGFNKKLRLMRPGDLASGFMLGP